MGPEDQRSAHEDPEQGEAATNQGQPSKIGHEEQQKPKHTAAQHDQRKDYEDQVEDDRDQNVEYPLADRSWTAAHVPAPATYGQQGEEDSHDLENRNEQEEAQRPGDDGPRDRFGLTTRQ